MSGNSSSNDSFALPPVSFHFPLDMNCSISPTDSSVLTSFFITNILLLLPLSIFIFYLGLQQWRRQSSASTSAMTHSDIFTYHLVTMEMNGVFGLILCCCGIIRKNTSILTVGLGFWNFIWIGETSFHLLTCVERYLAVVHPITYLSLRGERGIRLRNISIGCVWLLSIGGGYLRTSSTAYLFGFLCFLVSSLVIISFCSLSTLCVLIRPGPGEQGGNRKKVDQSKRRAFYTIAAILGVLLLRCVANVIWCISKVSNDECMLRVNLSWFYLPSSLVLPLLYLHRAETLACCKINTK